LTYPSEKYESQMGVVFPIYGNIENVPNHQPAENSSEHLGKKKQNSMLWIFQIQKKKKHYF